MWLGKLLFTCLIREGRTACQLARRRGQSEFEPFADKPGVACPRKLRSPTLKGQAICKAHRGS